MHKIQYGGRKQADFGKIIIFLVFVMILRIVNLSQRRLQVLLNHGNKVASGGLRYCSTKKQEISPKPTCNSTYSYGAPHAKSNIPSVEFYIKQHETKKEKAFREYKQDLMAWHHKFWLEQNEKFSQEKKKHLQRRGDGNTVIDGKEQADDLSLFYKEFLDKNFNIHFKYQREWYKRNLMLLWYGLQADVEKFLKRRFVKITRS